MTTTNGTSPTVPTTPDPAVVALTRQLARTERHVADLQTHLRQLAADVHALAERLVPPADADGPPPVRSWLLADSADQAVADLDDLIGWLDAVYLRYARGPLSACWLWHPQVVEELWWLRCAHADAYHPESGSWLRVGDWHDRQRPGVERRVHAVLGKCSLSLHAPRRGRGPDIPAEPDRAPMTDHAEAVAAAWANATPRDRAIPAPTAEQLTDAETHQRRTYRSHG
ncbi:MAG: hypothetical protein AB7L91_18240 [Dehalococcoidia bacterium]